MKKNLMSVIILALVFANFVLTAILMFTVIPQTKKANNLIDQICESVSLYLNSFSIDFLSLSKSSSSIWDNPISFLLTSLLTNQAHLKCIEVIWEGFPLIPHLQFYKAAYLQTRLYFFPAFSAICNNSPYFFHI